MGNRLHRAWLADELGFELARSSTGNKAGAPLPVRSL